MIAQLAGTIPHSWNATDSEAALRLCSQWTAYGPDCGFLRFYGDEQGNRLSVMDGHATLHVEGDPSEMQLFLTMDPSVISVRTDRCTAQLLAEIWGTESSFEAVMKAPAVSSSDDRVQDIALRDVYPVLKQGFADALPPFEAWYCDAHHRYRRGLCRSIAVFEEGSPVAVAMTVAECESAALIGAVTTLPQARGKGYASACVLTLSHTLQKEGKTVFLSPKNAYAHALYTRIGFTSVGEWGSVSKPR